MVLLYTKYPLPSTLIASVGTLGQERPQEAPGVAAFVGGHGLGAAMVMTQTRALLRAFSETESDPAALMRFLLGHPDVLVDLGGDVSARGRRPDGSRWRVAVEAPSPGRAGAIVELQDGAVATSSADRDSWTDAQRRKRSHVLDPRTAEPIAHALVSATVVHRDGAWADALATGLLVLGPDAGRALAAREGLAARLVLRQKDGSHAEWSTPAFDALAVPAR